MFVEVDGCGLLVGELAGKTKKQEERGSVGVGLWWLVCGGGGGVVLVSVGEEV